MLQYHLAIHLSGNSGRNMTLLDLNLLQNFFTDIHVKKFVICIEKATKDHLHAAYQLKDKRPNIKRDIIRALQLDLEGLPNNCVYNKRLKLGQKFNVLAGGYLQKGYKHITSFGISHIELEEGKQEYLTLKDHKVMRVTKYNMIRLIVQHKKEHEEKSTENALLQMLRLKKYNFTYVINKFTRSEIETLVYFSENKNREDENYFLEQFYKQERNYA